MTVVVDIFRVLASVSSTLMILSPIPSIYEMHKAKSTGHASIVPLVSMFFNCHVTMLYGYMDHLIFPVVTTFLTGDIFSLLYIIVFYYHTQDKKFANKMLLGFGLASAITTVYTVLGGYGYTGQSREEVTLTLGYVCIIATVVLYGSPFEKIGQVVKHRSGVFIPIHMVVAGVTSNGMWLVYSALTSEWIILAPNAFCCVMGCAQILLFLVFHPSRHPLHLDAVVVPQTKDIELGIKLSPKHGKPTESPCFVPMQSPPLALSQQSRHSNAYTYGTLSNCAAVSPVPTSFTRDISDSARH